MKMGSISSVAGSVDLALGLRLGRCRKIPLISDQTEQYSTYLLADIPFCVFCVSDFRIFEPWDISI